MFEFAIFLGLVAVVAIGAFLVVSRPSDTRTVAGWIGAVATVLFLVVLFLASFTTVSTRNVGIVVSFGRPVGQLDNGPHMIAPWSGVVEMPATVQTDAHVKDHPLGCVTVRIAYGMTGCVDLSVRWRIQEEAAPALYQNYQDFNNVRFSLVDRDLGLAANEAFADYDPLAFDENGNSTAPPLNKLGDRIKETMKQTIGSQIEIQSVFASIIHYDGQVQGRINALQTQVAQTKIAKQAVQTATAQAQANQALASSVSTNPSVLASRCLDILQEMVSKGAAVPPGFSCFGGSSVGVIVSAPK